MESSKPTDKIYCQTRKEWVKATPEEKIRQELLQRLILLGYPSSHFAVEKGLHQMPHLALKNNRLPLRRADIVCFGKGIHPQENLYPLLLIECKAVKITQKMISQAVGYNHYLKALFIAIANNHEIKTGWWNSSQKEYQFIPFLPSYSDLLQMIGVLPLRPQKILKSVVSADYT